ncbi:MAG TPA: ornithine cyclodeaminase family protein [Candidatus Eisenbacteria bacterium]|jgi:ornithine cyclodeaminase
MSVRVVSDSEVRALLPMADCIEVMAATLATVARGDAVLPLRSTVWLPDRRGLLGLMPAYVGDPRAIGIKVVTVMPGNHGTEHDSHQGAVLVFETEHGALRAVVDASSITAIRTAAVSALATRILAREDAGDLAILGSGVQAATHLDGMRSVRRLTRVRVWSRTPAHARAFAERESARLGLRVEACAGAREAVAGADLVCTATSAREPVLCGDWLAPGAHVNAVGACFANARELDSAAVARSMLFVDRRESARAEAGDFLIPKAEGVFGDDHIRAEIGEVLIGARPGRGSRDEVTLFKSLGLAVEDLAAAHRVWQRALETGAGTEIELGGLRAPA